MTEKILLVDDDPNVLSGYKRHLRKSFSFETAQSGQEGLNALSTDGPFAVVISDMRMPGMDGIAFLTEVKVRDADCVRMMLTGNADVQTCIDAVNEGSIFRFLTKPCSPDVLAAALRAGIDQYRLVTAERELLQHTLSGCIRVLIDILSLMNPAAFSRGSRIRRYVRHIAVQLGAENYWEYELAATLSQIGCVGLPPAILGKISMRTTLTSKEREVVHDHPAVGRRLLARIPRLELVAEMIGRQNQPAEKPVLPTKNMSQQQMIDFGAQLIRIALDLDHYVTRSSSFVGALARLQAQYGPDHAFIETLMGFEKGEAERIVKNVTVHELTTDMIAGEDIPGAGGEILLARGQRFTEPTIIHLQNRGRLSELEESFQVEIAIEDH